MVLLQACHVRWDCGNGLAPEVRERPDVGVEHPHGEEGGEVGGVGVGEDEDEEGVGGDDDAGGEGADSEDVDGEGVREAVPHALTQAFEDIQLAVFSVEGTAGPQQPVKALYITQNNVCFVCIACGCVGALALVYVSVGNAGWLLVTASSLL